MASRTGEAGDTQEDDTSVVDAVSDTWDAALHQDDCNCGCRSVAQPVETLLATTAAEMNSLPKISAGDIVVSKDTICRVKEMTTGYTPAQQRRTWIEVSSGSEVMLIEHVTKPINRADGHSYIAVLMKETEIDHPDIT